MPALANETQNTDDTTNQTGTDELELQNPADAERRAAMQDAQADLAENDNGWGRVLADCHGVQVRYNLGNRSVRNDYGLAYQCVEFVNRYYVLALGHQNMISTGHARDYLGQGDRGLETHLQGGSAKPQGGDLLVDRQGSSGFGHVGIVKTVNGTSVTVAQQNTRPSSAVVQQSLSRSGSGWQIDGAWEGWRRKPGAQPPAGEPDPGAGGETNPGPGGETDQHGGDEPAPTTNEQYTVQPGDTLAAIASRFNVPGGHQAIAQANNLANPNLIYVGQVLQVPVAAPASDANQNQGADSGPPAAEEGGDNGGQQAEPERAEDTTYTVQPGDALIQIAERFKVDGGYQALAQYNNIANPALISVGQVLRIPGGSAQADSNTTGGNADSTNNQDGADNGSPAQGDVPRPNPALSLAQQDQTVLMAMNLYAEARGEYVQHGIDALYGVAQVVAERVRIGRWGGSFQSVILAPAQFSWTRASDPNYQATMNPSNAEVWATCYQVAREVIGGGGQNPVGGADHYHANYVSPNWADPSKITARIGSHIFYDLIPSPASNNDDNTTDANDQATADSQDTASSDNDPEPAGQDTQRDAPIPGEGAWLGTAIRYNRARPYSEAIWRRLQEAIGTTADGDAGRLTARATWRWQDGHDLETDGKMGPNTKQSIESGGAEQQQEEQPAAQEEEPAADAQADNQQETGNEQETADEEQGYVETTDDLVNRIQRQHPGGIHVVLYGPTNDQVQGGYTANNNNREFTTQAEGQAEVRDTVGMDGSELDMGVAMPAINKTEVEDGVNTTYETLQQRYSENKPDEAPDTPEHLKIKNLSLFYHGIRSALSMPGENISNTNVSDFVSAVASNLRSDVGVQLYACSAAGGDNSLAENMADSLEDEDKDNANVFGHTSAAHTTENHQARVFGALGEGTSTFDVLMPSEWRTRERQRIWGELDPGREPQADQLLRQRLYRYFSAVCGLAGSNGWNADQRDGYEDVAPVQDSGYYASRDLSAMGRRSFVDPSGTGQILQQRWQEWARDNERGVLRQIAPLAETF